MSARRFLVNVLTVITAADQCLAGSDSGELLDHVCREVKDTLVKSMEGNNGWLQKGKHWLFALPDKVCCRTEFRTARPTDDGRVRVASLHVHDDLVSVASRLQARCVRAHAVHATAAKHHQQLCI